jgi:RNA polymerase sigma factor (sigma-70 family)
VSMPGEQSCAGGDEDPLHELLARMRAGDRDAARDFCVRMEPFLRRVSHRWITSAVRRQADSVDIAQSVMRRIVAGAAPAGLATDGRVMAWAATVVRNRIHTLARKRKEGEPLECAQALPAPTSDPATVASQAEDLQAFHDALQALPAQEQTVVLLHAFDGLDFASAAKALNRPGPEAARKLYGRALKHLRRIMKIRK